MVWGVVCIVCVGVWVCVVFASHVCIEEESLTFDAFSLEFIYLLIGFWTRMAKNGGRRWGDGFNTTTNNRGRFL